MRNPLRIGNRVEADVAASFHALTSPTHTGRHPGQLPIATPWGQSELERWVFADALGIDEDHLPMSRAAAMRLPAVARGRNLIVSTIARLPLVDPDRGQEGSPPWLYTTGDGSSPQLRNAWTVDDLIFHGWSLWWRDNGAADASGRAPILKASRVDFEDWEVDEDGFVLVNGGKVRGDDVIVIPGLHEGILNFGGATIRDAVALYRNVRARLETPTPQLNLHQSAGDPLTDTQIDTLISRWATARTGRNGGVGFTSEGIELEELGAGGEQLMIEARNAASLDLARMVGVSAGMIDATAPKASLNYETQTGRNQEFVDFDLALYMTPLTARLSLDDVTPHGRRVAFDLGDFIQPTPAPTGPQLED